jgi:hypothetical protein
VSRYLRGRLTAPSQTWRTFLANHIGQLTFPSPTTSPYAPHVDGVIEASGLPFCHTPLSNDELYASHRGVVVDWYASLQRTSRGTHSVQHVHETMSIRNHTGRGPPNHGPVAAVPQCLPAESLLLHWTSATNERVSSISRRLSSPFIFVNVVGNEFLRTGRARLRGDSQGGRNTGEAQLEGKVSDKAMADGNWRCPNSANQSVVHHLRRGISRHGWPTRFQPFRTSTPRYHPC